MSDPRYDMLEAVVKVGRFSFLEEAMPEAEEWVVVICDLREPIGKVVAELDYNFRTKGPEPDDMLWTFIYKLDAWQSFRREVTGKEDVFKGEASDGTRFVVISGSIPLLGRLRKSHNSYRIFGDAGGGKNRINLN